MNHENSNILEKYLSIPVVDIETIETLKLHAGGDEDVLKDLFNSFFPEAEEQILELKNAADMDNSELLKKSAHGLSGISATIGANQLKALTADMENYAKSEKYEEAYGLIEYVETFYEKFIEEAKSLLFS